MTKGGRGGGGVGKAPSENLKFKFSLKYMCNHENGKIYMYMSTRLSQNHWLVQRVPHKPLGYGFTMKYRAGDPHCVKNSSFVNNCDMVIYLNQMCDITSETSPSYSDDLLVQLAPGAATLTPDNDASASMISASWIASFKILKEFKSTENWNILLFLSSVVIFWPIQSPIWRYFEWLDAIWVDFNLPSWQEREFFENQNFSIFCTSGPNVYIP